MSCERDGCGHGFADHPDNGNCIKCSCAGFFRNDSRIINPLQEKYIQDTIDIKVRFNIVLDMASHLNEAFPKMAKDYFDIVNKENDALLNNLYNTDREAWVQVNNILHDYKTMGKLSLKGVPPKVLQSFYTNFV